MSNLEKLTRFELITDELIGIDITSETDEMIQFIQDKLVSRENIIIDLDSEEINTNEVEELLRRILQKNNQLETKFAEIKLGIGLSITELVKEKSLSSTKRKANRGYMNLGHQKDGYFIDKKK